MFKKLSVFALNFFNAQGHVRKLAALLHVPRAASSGEGRSPTRLI